MKALTWFRKLANVAEAFMRRTQHAIDRQFGVGAARREFAAHRAIST